MAIQINPVRKSADNRGVRAPQIQSQGRILQAAAPAPPKNNIAQGAADMVNAFKESRQKANRAKLVQGLVQEDDATEADAFDAPAAVAPTIEPVIESGGYGTADAFNETPAPPQKISPATPNASKLSQLNMPDQAKSIFKEMVKSGDTDGAYKIAMAFALKPAKEYTLSEGQRVTDAKGNVIAEGAPKSFAPTKPTKPVKAYNRKTGQEQYATPAEINSNPDLQASSPSTSFTDEMQGKIAADINAGMNKQQLIEKHGAGAVTLYGDEQLKSQQPRIFVEDGITKRQNPRPSTFFPPVPKVSYQEKRRTVINPPNNNSNMSIIDSNANSNMPIIGPSAGAPPPAPANTGQQRPLIEVIETPVMQTNVDKIQMQKIGVTTRETMDLINEYRAAVTKEGPQMYGMEAEDLKQKHTALTLKLKDLAELGVLAGPDLDLLYDLITPPDDFQLNAQDAIPFNGYDGTKVMLSQLVQMEKLVDSKFKAAESQYGPVEKRTSAVKPNVSAPKPKADTSGWKVNLKKD